MTKLSTIAAAFALTFSLAACQKAPDLAKMQEETIGAVKIYIVELDTLQRRADLLGTNLEKHSAAKGVEEASQILGAAKTELDQLRRLAGSTPTLAATAAKSNNPEEISKVHDETVAKLIEGIAIVKDELAASDAWLGVAENSQVAIARAMAKTPTPVTSVTPAATPPTSTPTTNPVVPPAGAMRGSTAPIGTLSTPPTPPAPPAPPTQR